MEAVKKAPGALMDIFVSISSRPPTQVLCLISAFGSGGSEDSTRGFS